MNRKIQVDVLRSILEEGSRTKSLFEFGETKSFTELDHSSMVSIFRHICAMIVETKNHPNKYIVREFAHDVLIADQYFDGLITIEEAVLSMLNHAEIALNLMESTRKAHGELAARERLAFLNRVYES